MIDFSKKNKPAADPQGAPNKIKTGLIGNNQPLMVKFRASGKKLATFAILIIIIGAIVFYFVAIKSNNKIHYVYPDNESYSLVGAAPGSGASFTKPKVFIKYAEATGQVVFHQSDITSGNTQTTVAYLAAAVNTADKAYSNQQLLDLKTIFAGSTPEYTKAVTPIDDFVKNRLPSNWQINLDRPGTFFNKDISDNAWQFTFNASDPKNKKITYKGQVLYAIEGNNFYYFMVATTSNNWQTNQKTWLQIFGSLQIGI